jgi:cystathionine beta-lyase/cystathionine gamma-synthase
MKTYPIHTMTIKEAKEMQFRLVDCIHQVFPGGEFLQQGDLGVTRALGAPSTTRKVEEVLSKFFHAEAAILVRGSGTGAIRNVMNVCNQPMGDIVLHDAPIYPTTKVIVDSMGLNPIWVNFNDLDDPRWKECVNASFALVQHSRQGIEDSYDLEMVLTQMKSMNPAMEILVDDNYTAMKAPKIGAQLGADASAFSLFKLLGPEGVGCIAGTASIIEKVRSINYSGGSQVQGYEAMEALRSMVHAPVALSIQAEQGTEIVNRLQAGDLSGIKNAFIANAQSRVVLVEFDEPIAKGVLVEAEKLGAAPYPVGAESKYEIAAMFYRVSGTFLAANPDFESTMIRINPMRAGAETVLRILKEAMEAAKK